VRNRDPRNTWRAGLGDRSGGLRVEGGPVRASLHHETRPDAIKGPVRKRGRVCDEGCWSYPRTAPRVSEMPRPFGSRGGAGRPWSRGYGSLQSNGDGRRRDQRDHFSDPRHLGSFGRNLSAVAMVDADVPLALRFGVPRLPYAGERLLIRT